MSLPPRVLIVSPERRPRALIRAQLREEGYDAVGATTLAAALRYPTVDRTRGPVRLVVVDADAVRGGRWAEADRLRARHPASRAILLTRGTVLPASQMWDVVLGRPVSIAQIVETVARLAPLPARERKAVDS